MLQKSYSTKSTYTMVRQTQKMRKMWKLLSGAAGRKPIIDDMQIFFIVLQYGTINESFIDAFRTAAKELRYLTRSNALPSTTVSKKLAVDYVDLVSSDML